jgi:GTPase SAR1 family protein
MTWQEAYKKLDPMEMLQGGDPRLYKDLFLADGFFRSVRDKLLLNKGGSFKLLLSGHTGCGKSTLLNYLADEDPVIKDNFFVVRLDIRDFVDPNEIDHIDLLLFIVLETVKAAHERGVKVDDGAAKRVVELANRLQGLVTEESMVENGRQAELSAEVGTGIPSVVSWLKASFSAKYRLETETRRKVRTFYRTRISELLGTIDQVLLLIRHNLGGKDLLLLVDGTDRPPVDKALELFYVNGQNLASPKCGIVYVLDTSLSCSTKYPAIRGRFSDEEFFPAVRVADPDGSEKPDKVEVLEKLMRLRVGEDIIPNALLHELCKLSGGVVRELVRLAREAVFQAQGRVDRTHVDLATIKIRNTYSLLGPHVRVLQAVLKDPMWCHRSTDDVLSLESVILDLLHLPAMFQYRNGQDKWHRPYPIFIPWLQRLAESAPS